MATIQEQINQLKVDKQTLVDNLVAKGVEATNNETFTTLVPKVKDIQGGVDISEYFNTNSTQVYSYSNVGGWYQLVKKLPSINHTGSSKDYLFSYFQGEELDTLNFTFPSGTTLNHMCDGCTKLKKINMSNMISENINISSGLLYSCSKLETIIFPDDIGTKFGSTNINGMFRGCSSLTTLPLINASNVVDIRYLFRDINKIANLGGFRNLGEAYLTTQSANYFNYKLDLSPCSLLTEQSIINVLNNLYDIASKGCNTQSVVLGSTNLAKLTSEAGQQALTQAQNYGCIIRVMFFSIFVFRINIINTSYFFTIISN